MMLADVIAMVVDGITTQGGFYLAGVIAMVADGITTGQLYFNFSSEMFNRTLYILFLRKLSNLHVTKQNEKHPYI